MVLPSLSTLIATAVLFGLLFALVRRPLTSVALTLYLLAFVLLCSFVKQAYLGAAVTLADMRFFLLRPVENFHLFVSYPALSAMLVGVITGVASCLLVGLRFEPPVRALVRPRVGGWLRAATAAVSVVLGSGASLIASQETLARGNDGDAYAAFLSMYGQQHPDGVIGRLNVFFDNRSFDIDLPAKRQQKRFSTDAAVETAQVRPDILLVLEESTFDPTLIGACPAALCDNAMLHPLPFARRTDQGPLLVHTTGGGTWLSEFAVLSGFDWRVFGRGGAYAPVSLAPRLTRSLPHQLHDLGYRTVAIYPTDGNFLSAASAYRYYGFDEFYDARDLNLPTAWRATRDALVFDKALALAAHANDPRPTFLFVLTIRNHGPHGEQPAQIPPKYRDAIHNTTPYLADYLARMHDSSLDFSRAAAHWLQSPRPRVIAWFGDHQPEAAWDYTRHAESLRTDRLPPNATGTQLQYLTRYQFSANFGVPATHIAGDALDISYLGAELATFATLPLDAAQQAARQAERACDGLMIDCKNSALIDDYLSFRVHELGAIR